MRVLSAPPSTHAYATHADKHADAPTHTRARAQHTTYQGDLGDLACR